MTLKRNDIEVCAPTLYDPTQLLTEGDVRVMRILKSELVGGKLVEQCFYESPCPVCQNLLDWIPMVSNKRNHGSGWYYRNYGTDESWVVFSGLTVDQETEFDEKYPDCATAGREYKLPFHVASWVVHSVTCGLYDPPTYETWVKRADGLVVAILTYQQPETFSGCQQPPPIINVEIITPTTEESLLPRLNCNKEDTIYYRCGVRFKSFNNSIQFGSAQADGTFVSWLTTAGDFASIRCLSCTPVAILPEFCSHEFYKDAITGLFDDYFQNVLIEANPYRPDKYDQAPTSGLIFVKNGTSYNIINTNTKTSIFSGTLLTEPRCLLCESAWWSQSGSWFNFIAIEIKPAANQITVLKADGTVVYSGTWYETRCCGDKIGFALNSGKSSWAVYNKAGESQGTQGSIPCLCDNKFGTTGSGSSLQVIHTATGTVVHTGNQTRTCLCENNVLKIATTPSASYFSGYTGCLLRTATADPQCNCANTKLGWPGPSPTEWQDVITCASCSKISLSHQGGFLIESTGWNTGTIAYVYAGGTGTVVHAGPPAYYSGANNPTDFWLAVGGPSTFTFISAYTGAAVASGDGYFDNISPWLIIYSGNTETAYSAYTGGAVASADNSGGNSYSYLSGSGGFLCKTTETYDQETEDYTYAYEWYAAWTGKLVYAGSNATIVGYRFDLWLRTGPGPRYTWISQTGQSVYANTAGTICAGSWLMDNNASYHARFGLRPNVNSYANDYWGHNGSTYYSASTGVSYENVKTVTDRFLVLTNGEVHHFEKGLIVTAPNAYISSNPYCIDLIAVGCNIYSANNIPPSEPWMRNASFTEKYDCVMMPAQAALYGNFLDRNQTTAVDRNGIGTVLQQRLASLGIQPGNNCSCNSLASAMNIRGADWVRENMDRIVEEIAGNASEITGATASIVKAAVQWTPAIAKAAIRTVLEWAIEESERRKAGEHEPEINVQIFPPTEVIDIDARTPKMIVTRNDAEARIIAANPEMYENLTYRPRRVNAE